jgi:hypothetical protein
MIKKIREVRNKWNAYRPKLQRYLTNVQGRNKMRFLVAELTVMLKWMFQKHGVNKWNKLNFLRV